MKLILPLIAAVILFPVPADAREVPFDAVVSGESALVRSGPGDTDYYPTQKLDRGTKVRVIREGYGGWYMIEPPAGSHSWIRAEFVNRRGDNKGIIKENTVDRIGSLLDRSNLTIIHKVVEGEIVTILGTATMRSGDKPVEMLKIAPPRGEYRYINRRDVTPADEYSSSGQPNLLGSSRADGPAGNGQNRTLPGSPTGPGAATGPFGDSVASGEKSSPELGDRAFDLKGSLTGSGKNPAASPGFQNLNQLPGSAGQGISMPGVSFETPQPLGSEPLAAEDQAEIEQAWQDVMQADGDFRQMLKRPVNQWNLASLKQVYQQSAERITNPSLNRQIENRMAAVDRYQKIYTNQVEIERILAQTESRDAEIRQSYLAKWHSVSTANPPTTRILRPNGAPTQPSVRTSEVTPTPAATVPRTSSGPVPAGQPATFAGAGVVQRSALSQPGTPAYVLLAPDGRVLSYLQAAPGVNLDQYIGKSVGITGARSFRRELNADLMIVRGLTPVKLQP